MTFEIGGIIWGLFMITAGSYFGVKEQRWAWMFAVAIGALLVMASAGMNGKEKGCQEFMNKLSKEVDLRQVPVKGNARFKFSGNIVFFEGKLCDVSLVEKTTVPDPFPVIKNE